MFFGEYLIEKGHVSMQQVLDALDRQREMIVTIGRLARREKILSDDQIYMILNRQTETHTPFGEAAVEMGFLSDEQLQELLALQLNRPKIGEILVSMNAISKDKMEEELVSFIEIRKQQEYDQVSDLLPGMVPEENIP